MIAAISGAGIWVLVIVFGIAIFLTLGLFIASRFKRCPSDRILVIFGKVGAGQSAHCIHGGGAFIWPLIQDSAFIELTPMTISIPLQNALSLQNIRIDVPSTFTIGVSTAPHIMQNAAERLLGLRPAAIIEMAKEIIFGQLRLTVASLTIEQINQDRESFLEAIRKNVEPELNKIGLFLINVNITDITDESDYISSIGKKAASEAINRAKIDVAEQVKLGSIGEAEAIREQGIRVAEAEAAGEKGKKKADADKRIFLQQQETEASIGESDSQREREIRIAENQAMAEKGIKKADADKRINVQNLEAEAVSGENLARAQIADSEASLAIKRAEAFQLGEVARRKAEAEIQKAQYMAEQERLRAEEIVRQEVEKEKIMINADAEAERQRRIAKGHSDAILMKYDSEARGLLQMLESKAEGYRRLVESCDGNTQAAATLLMIEKMEDIVARQVEAIKNIKIDKITVWDSAGGSGQNGNTTSNFISGLVKSIPPLQDIAGMAGVKLPEYLGNMVDAAKEDSVEHLRTKTVPFFPVGEKKLDEKKADGKAPEVKK